MCPLQFETVTALSRHQQQSGHHNRSRKKRAAEPAGTAEDHSLEQANLDISSSDEDSECSAFHVDSEEEEEESQDESVALNVTPPVKRQRPARSKPFVHPDPTKVTTFSIRRMQKTDPCHNYQGCRFPTAPRGECNLCCMW